MKNSKKQQYVIASTGVLIGIILIAISFMVGIKGTGIITAIFGVVFGGAGFLSFFNPIVSEVLGQIMKNLMENQEREKISQQQHKPVNSPQTGVMYVNQYINYNKEKKEAVKDNNYNKAKIGKRLLAIKTELNDLRKLNYKEGNLIFSPLKKEVRGIIHKVYSSNPETSEKRLIHKVFWIATASTRESEYQEWYLEDVGGLISTIDIIIREMDLE